MNEKSHPNKAIVSIIVIVLIGLAAGAVYYVNQSSQDDDKVVVQSQKSQDSTASESSDDKESHTGEYQDGTYEATGSYNSPGGREEITVSIVLSDGKVSDSSAKANAASGTSRQYQSEFIDNYKSLIIGKSLDEIQLDRVAGSSLTSNGFNDAVDAIKHSAEA